MRFHESSQGGVPRRPKFTCVSSGNRRVFMLLRSQSVEGSETEALPVVTGARMVATLEQMVRTGEGLERTFWGNRKVLYLFLGSGTWVCAYVQIHQNLNFSGTPTITIPCHSPPTPSFFTDAEPTIPAEPAVGNPTTQTLPGPANLRQAWLRLGSPEQGHWGQPAQSCALYASHRTYSVLSAREKGRKWKEGVPLPAQGIVTAETTSRVSEEVPPCGQWRKACGHRRHGWGCQSLSGEGVAFEEGKC